VKFHYVLKERRLRNLAGINLMMFTWSLGNGALWFLLPEISDNISNSLLMAGILVAFPSFISMMSDIPIGNLIKQASPKKILVTGLLLFILSGIAMPYAGTIGKFILFLFAIGILHELVYVPAIAYLITSTEKKKAGEYMGATMSSMHLGYALGPIILGLILNFFQNMEVQLTGVFMTAMCSIALIPSLALLKDIKTHPKAMHIKGKLRASKQLIAEVFDFKHLKSVGLTLLFTTFLLTGYDGMVWMLEPVYGFKLGMSPLYVGLLLSAFTLPLILFQVPAGILADRYGRKKVMLFGLATAGLFTVLFGMEKNPALMIAHAFMATLGLSMAWPAVDALVAKLNEKEDAGTIVGVWSSAKDLGYVIGPILGAGIAYFLNDIGGAFISTGLLFTVGAIVAGIYLKKD
jgi:DHA1 family multidrug resistance protein-like MFS transporter